MADTLDVNGETYTALSEVKEWCNALMILLREGRYSDSSAAQELGFDMEDYQLVQDRAHIGIIAFGDSVETILELTPVSELMHIDVGDCLQRFHVKQRSTSYGRVFHHLHKVLETDDAQLMRRYQKKVGPSPAVFFITDGRPMDSERWQEPYGHLAVPSFSPGIVALGFGKAERSTIAKIATVSHGGAGFIQGSGSGHSLIGSIFMYVINSVTLSSRNSAFSTPGSIPGFEYVPPQGY